MKLIIPNSLKKGDAIGFISPSSGPLPLAIHRIERAKNTLEKLGYKVKIADSALKSSGYVSASIEERVSDIHAMFLDDKVKAIMCTTGGNNSNHLLRHLDYKLIKKHPKIFIGYSDITVLHYALQSQANLATYYGPCAMTQFGEFPDVLDYTLKHFQREIASEKYETEAHRIITSPKWTDEFLDWFKKDDLKRPRKQKKNNGYEWLRNGFGQGPALGGAILSVNHLAGTKYWINPKGSIFFLDILQEGGLLNESAVDALLADLYNMELFDLLNGLIISRPAGYTKKEITRLKDMIKKYTSASKKKYPILFNANIGHTDPIITIRYGRRTLLDSSKKLFMFY